MMLNLIDSDLAQSVMFSHYLVSMFKTFSSVSLGNKLS